VLVREHVAGGVGHAEREHEPGLACISCHKVQNPGRAYFFMGTVYPTLHEADRCYSTVQSGTRVEILDADGKVSATFTVHAKGNFHSPSLQAQVPLPFTARGDRGRQGAPDDEAADERRLQRVPHRAGRQRRARTNPAPSLIDRDSSS
jgi:hypothetical protein